MSRIEWNAPGERIFETGVDRVVLYPRLGQGVPWNGVVRVDESSVGGDVEPLYLDGVKYMDFVTSENFEANIEAYAAPTEFLVSDGVKTLSPGLYVTQQPRKQFNFAYRTLIGNDLSGIDLGYKIHLVYNCTASPSGRNRTTISEVPMPTTQSWKVSTVPPTSSTFKPTAHLIVDSRLTNPTKLAALETILYGRNAAGGETNVNPSMPTPSTVVATLA